MLSRTQRAKAALIGAIGYPLIALLGVTLRWTVDGREHQESILRSGRQPILALWHGRILAGTLFWKRRGFVVITSENFDGEWIARIIRRFGFGTARGSTTRGGVKALVQLKREMAAGRPAAFTVDGPRGPARVAQPGAVWLAGATGNPLLPFHIESDRYWTLSSWDATQIPKPFSRVAIAIGPPLAVDGTDEATIEEQRRELERRLVALEARARELLQGQMTPASPTTPCC
jgi:lysophospholipid acyltransferase (LPLAT)-like uncharacterized protein